MKIVINISENIYTRLFDNGIEISLEDREAINIAIRGGTPLPKGHGRLIDADAFGVQISMIRDQYNYYGNEFESACFGSFDRAVDEVIDAPTIIEADEGETE